MDKVKFLVEGISTRMGFMKEVVYDGMEEFKVVQRKHAWMKRNLKKGFEVDLFLKLLVIFKEVTLKAAFLKTVLQEAIIMELLYSMHCRLQLYIANMEQYLNVLIRWSAVHKSMIISLLLDVSMFEMFLAENVNFWLDSKATFMLCIGETVD